MHGRAPFADEQVVFLEQDLATSEPSIGSEPQDESDDDDDRKGAHQRAERKARDPPTKERERGAHQRNHLKRPEPPDIHPPNLDGHSIGGHRS